MRAWLLVGLLLSASGVAGACTPKCVDEDGDSRGENCHDGPDCDDHDPRLGESCDAEAKKCAASPFEPSCPCLVGSRRECYSGDEGSVGLGICQAGEQRCDTGRWSACKDEVLATFERCNGLDDDCDGIVDDGVLSPCGGCDPKCSGGVWGPPATPFVAEGELDVTAQGELTLRLHELEQRTVWVPNTGEGTLSKVDADSAREVARYRVYGDTPERVAVDYNGDAWVLSPSLDGTSWLTRVAAGDDRCVDSDGDGVSTSRGPRDVLPLGDDECVLMHTAVGDEAEVARSLAVDGARAGTTATGESGGDVWVGMQGGERMLELDGASGEVVREIETPGLSPFDAAFDPWGALWVIDRQGLLGRIEPGRDPATVAVVEAPLLCYVFDALASDAAGLLTLTGFSCEDVITYDPYRDAWKTERTRGVLDTRGVAVLGDESWVVHTGGRISRVRRDPLSILDTFALADNGATPIDRSRSAPTRRDNSGWSAAWVVPRATACSAASIRAPNASPHRCRSVERRAQSATSPAAAGTASSRVWRQRSTCSTAVAWRRRGANPSASKPPSGALCTWPRNRARPRASASRRGRPTIETRLPAPTSSRSARCPTIPSRTTCRSSSAVWSRCGSRSCRTRAWVRRASSASASNGSVLDRIRSSVPVAS